MKMGFLAIVFLVFCTTGHSSAAEPNRGLLVWSAFQCSTFAELAGNVSESERLFLLGYEVGKELLNDLQNGKATESEIRKIPVGINLVLGGPSIDFIIGRIYSQALNDAYDSVVKTDLTGTLLTDPTKWADNELKRIRAKNKFTNSNCELFAD